MLRGSAMPQGRHGAHVLQAVVRRSPQLTALALGGLPTLVDETVIDVRHCAACNVPRAKNNLHTARRRIQRGRSRGRHNEPHATATCQRHYNVASSPRCHVQRDPLQRTAACNVNVLRLVQRIT